VPLSTDPVPALPMLTVEPWPDPVIDELGVDPRGTYTERFWLPVLGPSTVWFLRRVADRFDDEPDGFELDLGDAARCLGVGMRGGRNAPIMKTVERTCRFGAAQLHGRGTLAVRRRLAPLNRAQVERLPERLQAEHAQWITRPPATSGVEQMRERARRLALSLLELGEAPEAAERQLHAWRFHPAVVFEAVRWARATIAANRDLAPVTPLPSLPADDVPPLPAARAVAARVERLATRSNVRPAEPGPAPADADPSTDPRP
jgi:hypothetical protein